MGYRSIQISGDVGDAMRRLLDRVYGRVLDIEVFPGEEAHMYAAVAFAAVAVEAEEQVAVEAVVLLLRHDGKRGVDQYQIKDLPESMGPAASFCPERILDLLSPTENEYALEWRARCRDELVWLPRSASSAVMN